MPFNATEMLTHWIPFGLGIKVFGTDLKGNQSVA